jgi:hypothetical protein
MDFAGPPCQGFSKIGTLADALGVLDPSSGAGMLRLGLYVTAMSRLLRDRIATKQ